MLKFRSKENKVIILVNFNTRNTTVIISKKYFGVYIELLNIKDIIVL